MPDCSAVPEIAGFMVHSAKWGQFLQGPHRRTQRPPMKPGYRPISLTRRFMPFASACLIVSTSACATLARNGGTVSNVAEADPPIISGLPPELTADAALLRLDGVEPSTSVLQTRNRASRQADILQDFLASEGYLAADVRTGPISTPDQRPELQIEAGKLFRISEVALELRGEVDSDLRASLLGVTSRLGEGSRAKTVDIERLNTELVLELRRAGHAFAESDNIDAVASRRDATLDVTFVIDAGPLVRLGELRAPGLENTQPQLLRTLKTWTDGAVYRPATIDRLRARLRSTGIFDGIGVEVSQTPSDDGNHPVILSLVEAKRSTIGAGVTASTADGIGADAFWERRNITGRGDKVRISAEAATISQALVGIYERPNIGRFGRTLTVEAGLRAQETIAFDLEGARIGASLAQPFNRWFSVSAGAIVDATRTRDLRARFIGIERELVTLAFPLTATYSTVTEPLDPQSGNRAVASVESGVSFGDGQPGYTRFQLSGATYRKIADDLVVAGRATYGAFTGSNDVPIDKLFFAGGGGSVRGYEFQSLSPRDVAGNPVGGRSLFDTSLELRWRRSTRLGYTVFIDGGGASANSDGAFDELSAAFGVGVRYYPGFGPIRFDLATPLNPRPGDSPVQVYVSIGQSF